MVFSLKITSVMLLVLLNSSCGGGGGGNLGTTPTYGNVEGYVYVPIGSKARVTAAVPAGYEPIAGALATVTCGSTAKNATTNSSGYFIISSLPTGDCNVVISKTGYAAYNTTVRIMANQEATIGGSSGINLIPSTSGSVRVTTNISGGEVIIDNMETSIIIPSSLSYTFSNISPGNHTVSINQNGFEPVIPINATVQAGNTTDVVILMNPVGNHVPIADAGEDAQWFAGSRYVYVGSNSETWYEQDLIYYQLDASGSSDPDGDSLSYRWEQLDGPAISLSDAFASKPIFIPPTDKLQTDYTFGLSVSDGFLWSATDTVTVNVNKLTGKIVFQRVFDGNAKIYTVELENSSGTGMKKITVAGNDTNPAWSPDGGKVVYTTHPSGSTYYAATIDANGTGQNTLPFLSGSYDWFLSGEYLLVSKEQGGQQEFIKIKPDGTGEHQLTSTGLFKGFARVSPDGTKIAFNQDYGGDNFEIVVMNADGSNQTRITNNDTTDFYFDWMPDGRILYTSSNWLGDTIKHLYTMNTDGTGQQEITIPANVKNIMSLTVSSDGQFIFFSDSDHYLWVMYTDGSAACNLGFWGSNPDYHPGP